MNRIFFGRISVSSYVSVCVWVPANAMTTKAQIQCKCSAKYKYVIVFNNKKIKQIVVNTMTILISDFIFDVCRQFAVKSLESKMGNEERNTIPEQKKRNLLDYSKFHQIRKAHTFNFT